MPARATEPGNLHAATRTPTLITNRAESAIWTFADSVLNCRSFRQVTVCVWISGELSSRLPVAGYFGHLVAGGLAADVDPAGVLVPADAHADERVEGALVDAVISVAHDGPVDVARDHQDQRIGSRLERFLDMGGIEQPEGDV